MAEWNKTQRVIARVYERLIYEGTQYYYLDSKGRKLPIICRGSKIDGGVDIGQHKRETIKVDSEIDVQIKELYGKVKNNVENLKKTENIVKGGENSLEERILKLVYDTADNAMPIKDNNEIEKIINNYGVQNDGMIALGVFLGYGAGVCRHLALTCGVLLELLIKDGFLDGHVSRDRNYIRNSGGHAWCRYTNSRGETYVLDVAQGFFGKLKDAKNWDYRRPEDLRVKSG